MVLSVSGETRQSSVLLVSLLLLQLRVGLGISYLHGLSSLAVAMAGTRCGVETPRPRLCRKQWWCLSKTADIIAGLLFILGDKRKVVFSK